MCIYRRMRFGGSRYYCSVGDCRTSPLISSEIWTGQEATLQKPSEPMNEADTAATKLDPATRPIDHRLLATTGRAQRDKKDWHTRSSSSYCDG